jgi:tRNA (guanosine-2'-O-)-methyltransferase
VATSPSESAWTPENIPLEEPVAICFGTELTGLSDKMIDTADMRLRIPMHGFTESYNISVSAAIVSYTLMQRLRASNIPWHINDDERIRLKVQWTRNVLHSAAQIERRILDDARDDDASNSCD